MKKNKVQFRYVTERQNQLYGSCPLPRSRKILPKLYRGLKREKKVVLENESKIKDEKKIL